MSGSEVDFDPENDGDQTGKADEVAVLDSRDTEYLEQEAARLKAGGYTTRKRGQQEGEREERANRDRQEQAAEAARVAQAARGARLHAEARARNEAEWKRREKAKAVVLFNQEQRAAAAAAADAAADSPTSTSATPISPPPTSSTPTPPDSTASDAAAVADTAALIRPVVAAATVDNSYADPNSASFDPAVLPQSRRVTQDILRTQSGGASPVSPRLLAGFKGAGMAYEFQTGDQRFLGLRMDETSFNRISWKNTERGRQVGTHFFGFVNITVPAMSPDRPAEAPRLLVNPATVPRHP